MTERPDSPSSLRVIPLVGSWNWKNELSPSSRMPSISVSMSMGAGTVG